ncbi:MAG: hypothetical protein GC195_05310 [Nostoc sp. RI_552]|nr:hypothetical protein [Nostoc sp. RI_552]
MSLIPDFDIEIPFKGRRNYLHSSDVYSAVCNGVSEFTDIKVLRKTRLIFKDVAQRPLRAVFNQSNTHPKAIFTFNLNNTKNKCELIEREGEIENRILYDEEKIIEKCSFNVDKKSVNFKYLANFTYTPIEIVVAANKSLHLQYFKDCQGKWWFTEIYTEQPLNEVPFETLKLTLKTCLGTRLTKSSIFLDNTEFGYICFSLSQVNI